MKLIVDMIISIIICTYTLCIIRNKSSEIFQNLNDQEKVWVFPNANQRVNCCYKIFNIKI